MTLNDTFRKISGQLKSPVFEGVSKQILTKKYNHKKEKKKGKNGESSFFIFPESNLLLCEFKTTLWRRMSLASWGWGFEILLGNSWFMTFILRFFFFFFQFSFSLVYRTDLVAGVFTPHTTHTFVTYFQSLFVFVLPFFFLLWPLMVLKQEFLVCFRLFIQSIQNMSPTALCCSGSSVHPSGHQGQGTTWTVCLHHMAK